MTSLICKGGNILLQIVAIPMAFAVLGGEAFGVFAMISTLISFVILSELGIGPGLTNVLTKHIAGKDDHGAGVAFSTGFWLIIVLAALGCLAVIAVIMTLPVGTVFGERFVPYTQQMRHGVVLGAGIVFLRMVTSLGDRARAAYQETFVTNLYGALANVTAGTTLIIGLNYIPEIWFMILVVNGALAGAGVINMLHLWVQRPHLIPRLRHYERSLGAFLIRDGLAFCATLSLAPIAKALGLRVLLGHLGGPAAVAVFDVLERLMVFVFGFVIMFTFPLWPALSDAVARRDFPWIHMARKRLYALAALSGILFTLGLTFLGPWGIHLWLGGQLTLEPTVLFVFGLYASVSIWHHVHHIFLAGLDSIRLVSVIVLIELPLFLIAGGFGYDWNGFFGLFLGLALLGLAASFLFPHLALQRMRFLERATFRPGIPAGGSMITAVT